MHLDELLKELNSFDFIENYFWTEKNSDSIEGETYTALKIFGDEFKIAEIFLDKPYMFRTTYSGFDQLNMIEKQALLQTLYDFAVTPLEQRQSELYLAYFRDLSNITHFIKRMSNNRLVDEIMPLAEFKNLDSEQIRKYLFTVAEFDTFPKDYQPSFDDDSFVKVISHERLRQMLEDRYPEKDDDPDQE